jgi:transposase
MDEKVLFVADCHRKTHSMSALCSRFGISREAGYELLRRYQAEGPARLLPRSRRPHHSPTRTSARVVQALLALRQRWDYGPKKLLELGRQQHPRWPWPAPSTVAAILARAQLTQRRRRRRPLGHPGRPSTTAAAPNAIWTADFKGQFKTLDGVYCYPLTVLDTYSR